MTRTDVLLDVNWEGRETESGNVIYGWHLGTVCIAETIVDDGSIRYEVFVSHPQGEDVAPIVLHWSVLSTREKAEQRHGILVRQLWEAGEHGLFARQLESRSELTRP